jgi:Protein kinase domain
MLSTGKQFLLNFKCGVLYTEHLGLTVVFDMSCSDLKPENILIDYNGHIALCDFGLCKLNMTETETTNTFCGTPEYLAPELLLGHGYTKTVDWWTLGVLLYEMLTGLPPFYDENTNEMYRKILQDELRFPDEVSESARDLLRGVSLFFLFSFFFFLFSFFFFLFLGLRVTILRV